MGKLFQICVFLLISCSQVKALESNDLSFLLPAGYSEFSQRELLEVFKITDECSVLNTDHKERFVLSFSLDGSNEILALACDLGAYQDSYLVYHIDKTTDKVRARAIHWLEPIFDGVWSLTANSKLTGSLEVDSVGSLIHSLRLFSARGTCGFQVSYALEKEIDNYLLRPVHLTADNDCENGVVVDQWPEQKLSEM